MKGVKTKLFFDYYDIFEDRILGEGAHAVVKKFTGSLKLISMNSNLYKEKR